MLLVLGVGIGIGVCGEGIEGRDYPITIIVSVGGGILGLSISSRRVVVLWRSEEETGVRRVDNYLSPH